LESILDDTNSQHVINETAFPGTPAAGFWSASPYGPTNAVWVVTWVTGASAYYVHAMPDGTVVLRERVRCVRDADVSLSSIRERYVEAPAQGIVADERTQLAWRLTVVGPHSYVESVAYCASLGEGWRVPTHKELLTLVDPTHLDPAIDVSAFPGTPSGDYWASTAPSESVLPGDAADPVRYVSFLNGTSYFVTDTTGDEKLYTRCVR